MSDNLQDRGLTDRARINIEEPWEVRYWCHRLGCTEEELRDAVGKAGVMVNDVKEVLHD